MFNEWGVKLIDLTSSRSTRATESKTLSDNDANYKILDNEIKRLTKEMYSLYSVESGGSIVNSTAITEVLGELDIRDARACVFAVGSYIAGNNGLYYRLSLNKLQLVHKGLILPNVAACAKPMQIEAHVTLPYWIPSREDRHRFLTSEDCLSIQEEGIGCLYQYEDMCLSSLHTILMARRIQKNPIRVILFEPILAGCGGELSYRCYKLLAKLAEIHGIRFIVDEVLSFGRMGYKHGLYSIEYFPPEMHKHIAVITVGKWLGVGVMFKRHEKRKKRREEDDEDTFPRSLSTRINLAPVLPKWYAVFSKISLIPTWRSHVLEYLGVTNDNHWGEGLLIFLSGKLPTKKLTPGLHSRLLPKINSTLDEDKKIFVGIKKGSFTKVDGWDRVSINIELVSTIREYSYPLLKAKLPIPDMIAMHVCHHYQRMGVHFRDSPTMSRNAKKCTAYDVSYDQLLASVKAAGIGSGEITDAQLRTAVNHVLNNAKDNPSGDILIHHQVTQRRLHVWRAGKNLVYWQHLLDDGGYGQPSGHSKAATITGRRLCACETCLQLRSLHSLDDSGILLNPHVARAVVRANEVDTCTQPKGKPKKKKKPRMIPNRTAKQ